MALEHPELGRRVAQLREEASVSQRELAEGIGIAQSAVARVESGARRLDAAEAVAIADYFGVPVDAVVAGVPAAMALRADAADDEMAPAYVAFRRVIDDFFAFDRAAATQ